MQKDDLVYVGHMLDSAESAVQKLGGRTRDEFESDETLRLALTHLIQTMGEAARHVSMDFQRRHVHIPWSNIIGMRHKVVHDYLHVDYDLVWDVVTHELPLLIESLRKLTAD